MVEQGADVTARDNHGTTALHYAAVRGHLSVVEYLVGQGADVKALTDDGDTARTLAAAWGYTAVVEYLETVGG